MKFLFNPVNCTPFHRFTLDERPLGGTETGIIYLSNALAELGHEVIVVSTCKEHASGNPTYITPENITQIDPVDIYIAIRGWNACLLPIACKKRFYWTGDSFDVLHNFGIGDHRFSRLIDGLLCVSNWQANHLCQKSGFPLQKTWILRNGVHLANFSGIEKRLKNRLIYGSQPNRGLKYLPYIFETLRQKHPKLELHIFSSGLTYVHQWSDTTKWDPKFDSLMHSLKKLEGCHLHGNILQKELAREYMRSSIWAYPTNFEETSCISAMEAQAAGCAIVTSAVAALNETVGNAGILLTETPGSKTYLDKFIQMADRVLTNDDLFKEWSQKSLENAKGFDWKTRAKSFLEYLRTTHHLNG